MKVSWGKPRAALCAIPGCALRPQYAENRGAGFQYTGTREHSHYISPAAFARRSA